MPMSILIPVLGDQLSHGLASLREVDRADAVVLIMEVMEETTYVRHHQRKIALILSAMRHFAAELRAKGWMVDYVRLDDPANTGSFTGEVKRAVARHGATSVRIVECGEWRVKTMIDGWSRDFGLPVEILPDDRFICSTSMQTWRRRQQRRWVLYRDIGPTGRLRTPTGAEGGVWNMDRIIAPPSAGRYPEQCTRADETRASMRNVAARFAALLGAWRMRAPVTAAQAKQAWNLVRTACPLRTTDAMVTGTTCFSTWLSQRQPGV